MAPPSRRSAETTVGDGASANERSTKFVRGRHVFLEIVSLSVLWLLFSGKYDALHLTYGVISVALVVFLTRYLVADRRYAPVTSAEARSGLPRGSFLDRIHWGRALVYPFWLLGQILTANLQVAAIILRPKLDIRPVLLYFDYPVDCAVTKVTLGNSITLTPGTFTLGIRGDQFVVHAIEEASAGSIVDGSMPRRVASVYGIRYGDPPQIDWRHEFDREVLEEWD